MTGSDVTFAEGSGEEVSSRSDLVAVLRRETQQAHAELDDALSASNAFRERTGYVNFLRGSYRAVAALEKLLASSNLRPEQSANRLALLGLDLADLATPLPAPAPTAAEVFGRLSAAEALGVGYVLGGSALGGRVLARRVDEAFGVGNVPTRYLRIGGERLAREWRTFTATIDAWGEQATDAARAAACSAARRTFGLFLESFRSVGLIA